MAITTLVFHRTGNNNTASLVSISTIGLDTNKRSWSVGRVEGISQLVAITVSYRHFIGHNCKRQEDTHQ